MDPHPDKANSSEKMNEHLQKIHCLLLPTLVMIIF